MENTPAAPSSLPTSALLLQVACKELDSRHEGADVLNTQVIFRSACIIAKRSVSLVTSFRSSVCMKQLGSQWTDLHEILYLRILGKYLQKIQVPLKSGKNNGYSVFFWEFPRRLKFKSRRFGTQCRFHRPGRSGILFVATECKSS